MKLESVSPSYHYLKNEIKEGKLRLLASISPARTTSTALEMVLGKNSKVDATVTQPFTFVFFVFVFCFLFFVFCFLFFSLFFFFFFLLFCNRCNFIGE